MFAKPRREKFRKAFTDDLDRYAALVLDAAAAGQDRHADLSTHQEFLGVARSHLDATGALAKGRAVKIRLVGKQSVSVQNKVALAKKDFLRFCWFVRWRRGWSRPSDGTACL